MGPIQSSLNQLTLSALGAIAGVAKGVKGGFAIPQAPQQPKSNQPKPKVETSKKAQYTFSNPITGVYAESLAQQSGNDMIQQKARSIKVKERLAYIRKRKGA